MTQPTAKRQMAFILLERPVSVDPGPVVEKLQGLVDAEVDLLAPSRKPDGSLSFFMARYLERTVVVASMPAPLPPDEELVARASMQWPEARSIWATHQAHLAVSTVEEGAAALPAARAITAIVGALLANVPGCMAVLWNARVARPAATWNAVASAAFAPYPDFPLALWLDVQPYRYEGGVGMITVGLTEFIGREIQLESASMSPQALVQMVLGLSTYLIERGSPVPDGHTFGRDENEKIRLRHVTSRRFPGVPVLFAGANAA
jgi:hypothetical protein